jgi:hypothetical protein
VLRHNGFQRIAAKTIRDDRAVDPDKEEDQQHLRHLRAAHQHRPQTGFCFRPSRLLASPSLCSLHVSPTDQHRAAADRPPNVWQPRQVVAALVYEAFDAVMKKT